MSTETKINSLRNGVQLKYIRFGGMCLVFGKNLHAVYYAVIAYWYTNGMKKSQNLCGVNNYGIHHATSEIWSTTGA